MHKRFLKFGAATLAALTLFSCEAAAAPEAKSRAVYGLANLARPEVEGLVISPDDKIPRLTAKSAALVDASTGLFVYERNMNERMYPASTTKIMTLIMALEKKGDSLDELVTISRSASGMEGSTLWLEPGDKIPLGELLTGMMLASGNDAAVAIAEYIGGSVPEFARMMTEKAHELGAADTNFVNSCGLPDPQHYTTAHDMALIAAYGYSLPHFREIVSTKEVTYPWIKDATHRLRNENQMLWLYDGGNGVKTGYTDAAGRCLVSGARADGMQLVSVVFDSVYMWTDSILLLDYGYQNLTPCEVVRKGDKLGLVHVEGGYQDAIEAVAADDLTLGELKGAETVFETRLDVPKAVKAPVKEGDRIGELVVLQNGKELARIEVAAGASVERKSFFLKLQAFFSSLFGGLF